MELRHLQPLCVQLGSLVLGECCVLRVSCSAIQIGQTPLPFHPLSLLRFLRFLGLL